MTEQVLITADAAIGVSLAALTAVLVVLSVATARRPALPVPDRDVYLDRWSALHGGYDPRASFWARWWLGVTYVCARPMARAGVQPDVLTGWGVVVSLAVVAVAGLGERWPLLAIVVVVASGLADNLDGAVAVLTDRATRFGMVLDSLVDRVSDGLYLVALWRLGAPAGLCVAGAALATLQEYGRARAGNAGMSDIGVATAWERPTRVVLTAFTFLGCGLYLSRQDLAASLGAAAWVGLGVVGLVQLLVVVRRRLSAD